MAPSRTVRPARIISGKYQLLRILGEGSAGAVWEAENTLVGRPVAIKILHPSVATRRDIHQRFLAEARLSAKLAHPNVVDVYDLGRTDEGAPYIVMELLRGETLESMLKRRGRVPSSFACELMIQVLGTLQAAHKIDIVHRDLKPANIMLTYPRPDEAQVKVLDFGVAQGLYAEAQSEGDPGLVFGTPEYMAPEQAMGSPVDARCDIYSVGAILYELIGGEPPFTGPSQAAVFSRLLLDAPAPLHQLAPDVERDLESVVMMALSRSTAIRPQSALEMSNMLSRFAGTRETHSGVQLSAFPLMLTQKKRAVASPVVQIAPAAATRRGRVTIGFSKRPPR